MPITNRKGKATINVTGIANIRWRFRINEGLLCWHPRPAGDLVDAYLLRRLPGADIANNTTRNGSTLSKAELREVEDLKKGSNVQSILGDNYRKRGEIQVSPEIGIANSRLDLSTRPTPNDFAGIYETVDEDAEVNEERGGATLEQTNASEPLANESEESEESEETSLQQTEISEPLDTATEEAAESDSDTDSPLIDRWQKIKSDAGNVTRLSHRTVAPSPEAVVAAELPNADLEMDGPTLLDASETNKRDHSDNDSSEGESARRLPKKSRATDTNASAPPMAKIQQKRHTEHRRAPGRKVVAAESRYTDTIFLDDTPGRKHVPEVIVISDSEDEGSMMTDTTQVGSIEGLVAEEHAKWGHDAQTQDLKSTDATKPCQTSVPDFLQTAPSSYTESHAIGAALELTREWFRQELLRSGQDSEPPRTHPFRSYNEQYDQLNAEFRKRWLKVPRATEREFPGLTRLKAWTGGVSYFLFLLLATAQFSLLDADSLPVFHADLGIFADFELF